MSLTCSEIQELIKCASEHDVAELEVSGLKVAFARKRLTRQTLSTAPTAQIVEELLEKQEIAENWLSAEPPAPPADVL